MPTETPTWDETAEAAGPSWDATQPEAAAPKWDDTSEPARQTPAFDASTWKPDPIANAYAIADQQYMAQYGTRPDPFGAHDTAFTLALFHQFPEDAARVSKAAVADAAAGMGAAFMPGYTLEDAAKASGNLPAAFKREALPIDYQLTDAALEAQQRGQIPWEATTGKISQGVSGTLPLMLGMATLPAAAQRLAMLGFTYSMMKDAPEVARQLGDELGKPPELQDQDKISTLVSEGIQITGFAPLSAVGAARGGPAKWNEYAKAKGLPTIPDAAMKPIKPLDWAIEQAKKIPVQVQPKTAPKYERAKVPEAEAEKAQAQAEREAEQGRQPEVFVKPEDFPPPVVLVPPAAAPAVPVPPAQPEKVETPFGPGVVQEVQHGGALLDVKLEGGESRLIRAEDVMTKEPPKAEPTPEPAAPVEPVAWEDTKPAEPESPMAKYMPGTPESRTAWQKDLHPLSVDQGSRWEAIENTYHTAKAAQEALPGVPLKDIFVLDIYRKGTGATPSQSQIVDSFFVTRQDAPALGRELDKLYPSKEYGSGMRVNVKPYGPRKGEPSFAEWLEGKRPAPEQPAAQPAEPVAVDQWLKVKVPDVDEARENVRVAQRSIDRIKKELEPLRARQKELEKMILNQRGPRWDRGKIKKSARKSDVSEYRNLGEQANKLEAQARAIADSARVDTQAVSGADTAKLVNDESQPLLRRLASAEELYKINRQAVPKELAELVKAEADKATLEQYPDATADELKRVRDQVIMEGRHAADLKSAFRLNPALRLGEFRRASLEAAVNSPASMKHQFPPELWEEIHKFSPVDRPYSAKPAELAELTVKELDALRAKISSTSDAIRARLEKERQEQQERDAAESAKQAQLVAEAQAIADSAPKTGTKGGRTAKDVKAELLDRLEKARDKAASAEAAGERQPRKVTIAVPGDGVFTLENTAANLTETIDRAKGIDTGKGYGSGRVPYRSRGAEKPPTEIKTVEQWNEAVQFFDLQNTDTIADRSHLFSEIARKVNPEQPETVKVFDVNRWIEEKRGGGSSGTKASPAMRKPGGELGEPPKAPADDPRHSVFDAVPMELPEAVRVVKALTGAFPRIRERLRALGGRAAGVFRFGEGAGAKGRVELRADLFDLLTREEKNALKQEAFDYAKATAKSDAEFRNIYRERYKFLLDEAYQAAKSRNPVLALKVIWHEIGHVVDWLPDNLITGRGNLFGRLATLKKYFNSTLPLDPTKPAGAKLTATDRARLEREALKQLRDEFGPMREIIRKIIIEEPEFKILGITPQDVINIMGEFAGKDTPELTRWFSEQSREVKAEVLRKAMRGMLDERLAALGKKVQTGTRKTEKTVRERVGREPTLAEVRARFAELLAKEIKARNLADLQTVKKELEGAIAWWRGTEKMEDYFKPSEEMYAEAFSIFANNPAALETRAPTYAKLIWNYMDRKPQVRALYDQIQADIKAGNIMPGRVKGLYEMWDGDDARSLRLRKESLATSVGDFYDNVRYHFDRRFGPIYSTAKGYAQEGALREAVGTFLYRATEHERFLADVNNSVGKTLVANNLDWSHDLGEYLFHKRVTNERFNIANPLGWTSKNSLERLAEMQRNLGPERWAALESAADTFHQLQQKYVVGPVVASRMFTEEVGELLKTNLDYATFQAVKDIPDKGIEKLLMMRYGANVTPHIYRQIGNLGEVKNPATATVLKGLSLITAVYRNTMKREVVRMIREQDPDNIMPARQRWNGKFREPVIVDNHPTVGTVVYMEGGRPQAFYVRKLLADAVNQGNPTENLLFRALIKATGWQKGLFTQLNYAFWPVNFVRDTMGAMMQLPGTFSGLGLLKQYPKALRAARDSVTHARPNEAADAVLKRKMVISQSDPRGIWAAAENEYELKLASFGMDPAQWSREAGKVHGLVKAWNYYRELGQTGERVNKIAGMLYLDEKFPTMPEWKKREIVRERSGSPNFLERGASNPAIDLFWLFYNPWKEGIRSVAKSAVENPFSFGSKAVAFVLLPTIIQAAAVNGWLGEDTRKRYRSVPDYYLSNYLLPWVDWADKDQGKVAAFKLPLWEPARIAHGALFRLLTGRGTGLMSHAGGQLPSMNPIWQVGLAWSEYMLGKNPYDVSRGVNVLTDTEQQTRGPQGDVFVGEPLAEMGKFTWNEMGGSILHRFRNLNLESPPANDTEKFLGLPIVNNALGRWITVTDRGNIDEARMWAGKTTAHQADVRLACQQIADKLLSGQALTGSERMVMRDPYAVQYLEKELLPRLLKARALPLFRQLEVAPTTQGKAEVLRESAR